MKKHNVKIVCICMLLIIACILGVCVADSFALNDYIDISDEVTEQIEVQNHAHEIAEHARALGLSEDCDIIISAKLIWQDAAAKITNLRKLTQYTNDELRSLTCTIYMETGHRSDDMRTGEGACVMNRVMDPTWPNTINAVISQKGQWNPWYITPGCEQYCHRQDNIYGYDYWSECESIAKTVLMGLDDVPDNVVYAANFPQGSGTYKYWADDNFYLCFK